MKNRIAIACAIAILVGGLCYLSSIPDGNLQPQQYASLDFAQSVTGNGTNAMTGAPAAWTVIVLRKDYKNEVWSKDVLDQFATNETLQELRKCSEVRTMVEGDPLLSAGGPLEGIKFTPCVAIIDCNGKLLFKRSGDCAHLGDDIADEGILNKIAKPLYANANSKLDYANAYDIDEFGRRCSGGGCSSPCGIGPSMEPLSTPCLIKKVCPSCPFHPSPKKTEPVVDTPETPAIPDTPRLGEKKEEDDHFLVFAALIGCVAGVVSYFRQ